MPELRRAGSIVVASSAATLYDLVSDVTRMGDWSPICRACWWDEDPDSDGGPQPGAWFTGLNEVPGRVWETRSQVVAADRGREFTFVVGGSLVRWSYTFAPVAAGTLLTEEWEFLAAGLAVFAERFGERAAAEIADRSEAARVGIPRTLAAIKRTAEA